MSKGAALLRLHEAPELLVLPNVWDVASARVVAGLPGCRAVATASYAVAASLGYEDGEKLSLDDMLGVAGRIVAAVDLPVTVDLEGGYGDPGTAVGRAAELGVVGANIEDANAGFDEAVSRMAAAVKAGGPDFVLNARTDVFLGGSGDVEEAIRRGRAFLEVGAACVFVPGVIDVETIGRLVAGIGERKVSLMGMPGLPPQEELQALGVARLSFGPWMHRVALTAFADAAAGLLSGGTLPSTVRPVV